MAFNFEDLKKRANELAQQAAGLAQQGANRSRQLAGVAKLKAANLGEEDTIRKAYAELGKIYFAKYGEHPEDEFAAACETIIEAQAAIAANNATIEEMSAKKEDDVEIEIVEGTINEDMTVIVHYYPKEWPLTIRYIYPDGRQAAETYTATVKTGEGYDVLSPVIEGYKAMILRVKGVMDPGRAMEYTVIYVPEGTTVPDEPVPLGLEKTFMQVGVCYE
jgi:hypothetical protein